MNISTSYLYKKVRSSHLYQYNMQMVIIIFIQPQDADMVMAPLASNLDREHVMDFTEAFYLDYTAVLVRYTDLNAGKWRLYLQVSIELFMKNRFGLIQDIRFVYSIPLSQRRVRALSY